MIEYKKTLYIFDDRLAQLSEYPPIAQGVAGSIPSQYKHLCAWACLFVLGLGIFLPSMYVITKKNVYKYS
jgi:hypothetical protein